MREEMIMPSEATGDRNPGLPVRVEAARIASAFAAYEVGGSAVRSQLRARGGLGPDGLDVDDPALGDGALEAILARFTRAAEFRAILEEAYISGILGEALEGAHRLLGLAVGDRLSRLASDTLLTTELRGVMARIVAFPIVLTTRGGRDSFSALAHAALVRAATDARLFPFGAASAAIPLRPRGVAESGDAGLAGLRRDLEAAVAAAIAGDDTAAPEDDWLPEPDARHPIAARAFIAPVAVIHRVSCPRPGRSACRARRKVLRRRTLSCR